ncbi:FAD-binding oxidoreductase [Streptomyces sp. V1I6]|uniref:FAD-binding oxidoreductase n=1 Tax=Streptomyces sp. V1I6 TaxID=3042273 RepID=UPI002789FE0C|nr:FAD-linked oxidase C-terminal domain-containing protein [Streptomyces sp. V1I6]MDQ0840362.1 FAD/FMN-containing dehydrogenase [Streptomyces sp. V1I6]
MEADGLFAARRFVLPSLERLGRVLIKDIAVPRTQLAAGVWEITVIAELHDVQVSTLAHAADGNLHPILGLDPTFPDVPEAAWPAAGDIFTTALRLGGTLTGEHKVGTLKRRWLAQELGPEQHALQQGIKAAFDPHHILNPGKAL